MNKASEDNLQEPYLNNLRKRRQTVLLYLTTGMKHSGVVESFDRHVLYLRKDAGGVLIYKHMIASIMPASRAMHGEEAVAPGTGVHRGDGVPITIRKRTRSPI